jgi:hypothetical protein
MNAANATGLLLAFFIATVSVGRAQPNAEARTVGPVPAKKISDLQFKHQSFTFVRIQYSVGRAGSTPSPWLVDYPEADVNFSARFQKETGLKGERESKVMTLTNAELSRFPFIYVSQGGRLGLSEAEVSSLRRYLTGGGFLMVDDFWGDRDWKLLQAEMKRVFPDREPVELSIDHPVFHCYYDIQEKPQVPKFEPTMLRQSTGITSQREDTKEAHYRGLVDDKGRLMAILCHNTDLGDGWERESDSQYYFREFSLKKAYPMGINIVVYALTR